MGLSCTVCALLRDHPLCSLAVGAGVFYAVSRWCKWSKGVCVCVLCVSVSVTLFVHPLFLSLTHTHTNTRRSFTLIVSLGRLSLLVHALLTNTPT